MDEDSDSSHSRRMGGARIPADEARRLAALRELDILDTPHEAVFDDIVRIARSVCGAPIALISMVDADRQWMKARVGLDADETPRETSFCAHAILDDEVFVVHDASVDDRFFDNPFVNGAPHIRFYAGAPLSLPGGDRVGTLCLIDTAPRTLTADMRDTLMALKRQAEAHLALRARGIALKRANEALVTLQAQKEQLVQFVVHDMKNAVTAMLLNAQVLLKPDLATSRAQAAAGGVVDATAHLERMIDDMLDIAGAELGSPLRAHAKVFPAGEVFEHVTAAFSTLAARAGVALVTRGADLTMRGDPYLLRRVLENLIANALQIAPNASTIRLEAEPHAETIHLVVSDVGPGISDDLRESIFELYGTSHCERSNYGIGLAFCRVAVRAQHGRIWAEPNHPVGTRFIVELPAA